MTLRGIPTPGEVEASDQAAPPSSGTRRTPRAIAPSAETRSAPTQHAKAPSSPAPSADGEDPWFGQHIAGRYVVRSRLGEGGMATVYEAENLVIKKRVAIKIVDPRREHGPEIAARFLREVEATSRIEHPHVAFAFDGGTLPTGEVYLVSQLVRGETLRERLRRGPMPWHEAALVAQQIADALGAIHHAGFVHRDLTPSNVVLASGRDGRPHAFVVDLGIAARLGDGPPTPGERALTLVGTTLGTPGYMSPEQAVGKQVDGRSDLYTLGLLFFEMVTGKAVLASDAGLSALATKMLGEELGLPEPAALDLPGPLDGLARSLLAARPDRRPADAAAVRRALEPWTRPEEPGVATTLRRGQRALEERLRREAPRWRARASELQASGAALLDRLRRGQPTPTDKALVVGALLTSILLVIVVAVSIGGEDAPPAARISTTAPAAAGASDATAATDATDAEEAPGADPATAAVEMALMGGRTRAIREEAAATIIAAEDGVYPRYARLVAVLSLARTCDSRRAQIEALAALGDARAIPALERIASAPRTGCGRRSREDCYACIREPVDAALAALRAE